MKFYLLPIVLIAAMASPVQAMTEEQEFCLMDSIGIELKVALSEEFASSSGAGRAHDVFKERAGACADATGVSKAMRADYIQYGILMSVAGVRRAELESNGYRVDLFDRGLEELVVAVPDAFQSSTGLTEDAVDFMSDFFDAEDEDFIPMEDEDQLALFNLVKAYRGLFSVMGKLYAD